MQVPPDLGIEPRQTWLPAVEVFGEGIFLEFSTADKVGLLIYTADGDSEGSLGGLVRQGRNDRLGRTITGGRLRLLWSVRRGALTIPSAERCQSTASRSWISRRAMPVLWFPRRVAVSSTLYLTGNWSLVRGHPVYAGSSRSISKAPSAV